MIWLHFFQFWRLRTVPLDNKLTWGPGKDIFKWLILFGQTNWISKLSFFEKIFILFWYNLIFTGTNDVIGSKKFSSKNFESNWSKPDKSPDKLVSSWNGKDLFSIIISGFFRVFSLLNSMVYIIYSGVFSRILSPSRIVSSL